MSIIVRRIFWLMLLSIFAPVAISQDTSEWIRIDCGSGYSYHSEDGTLWSRDEDYIRTGTDKQLSNGSSSLSMIEQLNTLRVFPEQNKNCYILPATANKRYFIKAAFHYGNHDGLSKPPTFDLEFDAYKWTTVSNLTDGPKYYELVYTSRGENVSVCLARTFVDQYPFISTLELWPMPDGMYAGMRTDVAWQSAFRYMYGATDPIFGYPKDLYNRVWQPMDTSPGFKVLTADFTSILNTSPEHPPDLAMLHAMEASTSIPNNIITIPPSTGGNSNLVYYMLHFTETRLLTSNETRSIDVLEDTSVVTVVPQYRNCTTVSYGTYGSSSIVLEPSLDELATTLPPIVSAVEMYSSTGQSLEQRTSQNDLDGLRAITEGFKQLQGWRGDPCLPVDTHWQWLSCDGEYFPMVTSINLSSYGLSGSLPDFSQMQALETIDLRNNSLSGSIPGFLGQLPKLKLLILANNKFTGTIPKSIISRKQLVLVVEGNDVHRPRTFPHPGVLIALFLALLSLTFLVFVVRKKRS